MQGCAAALAVDRQGLKGWFAVTPWYAMSLKVVQNNGRFLKYDGLADVVLITRSRGDCLDGNNVPQIKLL